MVSISCLMFYLNHQKITSEPPLSRVMSRWSINPPPQFVYISNTLLWHLFYIAKHQHSKLPIWKVHEVYGWATSLKLVNTCTLLWHLFSWLVVIISIMWMVWRPEWELSSLCLTLTSLFVLISNPWPSHDICFVKALLWGKLYCASFPAFSTSENGLPYKVNVHYSGVNCWLLSGQHITMNTLFR